MLKSCIVELGKCDTMYFKTGGVCYKQSGVCFERD